MPKKKSDQEKSPDSPLSVNDAGRPVPADEATATSDVSWLDEGFIGPEAGQVDPALAEIPGTFEPKLSVDACRPNAWNPNEMDDKQFDMLVRRMKEVGMLAPIQVVPTVDTQTGEEFYMILGGEHRWRAAKELGYPTIPAVVLTDERFGAEDLQKFVTMQLNAISGELSSEKFLKLYQDLRKRYADKALKDLMGFTKAGKWKLLTKNVESGLPPEMREEFSRRAASIKEPGQLKGILNDLMGKYGNDLQYNFMILSHEGFDHIWVRLSERNHERVQALLDYCRARAVDVNLVLEEAFEAALQRFEVDG